MNEYDYHSKMRKISFRIMSKYLIFPFLCPVFYSIREVAFKNLHFTFGFTTHPLIVSLIMFISELICGLIELIIYLIQKICGLRNNAKNMNKKKETEIYYNKLYYIDKSISDKSKEHSYLAVHLFLLYSSFIDFFCYTFISLFCVNSEVESNNTHIEMRIAPIFFMHFLSALMFKTSTYRHQKVSIIIVGIGFSCFIIRTYLKRQPSLMYYLYFLIIQFIYSLKQISDKYIMDKMFFTPLVILFFQGLYGVGISIIFIFIGSFFPCYPICSFCEGEQFESFATFNTVFANSNTIGYLLLLLFSSTFLNIALMLTKKYFTLSHRSVADTMNAVCTYALLFVNVKSIVWSTENYLNIVGYILILFGCLIFNEMIIFHFCGLDKDTKSEIIKRGNDELRTQILEIVPIHNNKENNIKR